MVRNLPMTLAQSDFLEELDRCGFAGLYDFCYMPCSFETGHSKGYAFVNFTSTSIANSLVASWHRSRKFDIKLEDPALNVSPAAVQGFHANVAKWTAPRMSRIRNPHLRPFVLNHTRSAFSNSSNTHWALANSEPPSPGLVLTPTFSPATLTTATKHTKTVPSTPRQHELHQACVSLCSTPLSQATDHPWCHNLPPPR